MGGLDAPHLIPKLLNKSTIPSFKEGYDSSITQNSETLCEKKEEYKLKNRVLKIKKQIIKETLLHVR